MSEILMNLSLCMLMNVILIKKKSRSQVALNFVTLISKFVKYLEYFVINLLCKYFLYKSACRKSFKAWFPPMRLTYSHVYSYEKKYNLIGGNALNNLKKVNLTTFYEIISLFS